MKFNVGDRVESRQPGFEYTGSIDRFEARPSGNKYAYIKRDDRPHRDWQCKVLKSGDITTASGFWDGTSTLRHASDPTPFEYYFSPFLDYAGLEWSGESYPSTNQSFMSKVSSAFKRFLSPELQTQTKAGFRNGDLMLTEKGKNELLELLAVEKAIELTAAAQEALDDEKED